MQGAQGSVIYWQKVKHKSLQAWVVSPNREKRCRHVHVATDRVITFCNITIWQVTSGNGPVFWERVCRWMWEPDDWDR